MRHNPPVHASPQLRGPLARFWVNDYGLHILLVALLATMFLSPALVAARLLHPLAVHLFFTLTVISGVMTVVRRGRLAVLTVLLALLTIGVRFAELRAGLPTVTVLDSVLSAVMVALLVALILVQVFRAGPVTVHRIEGAVAVYLLIGLLWGCAYRVVYLLVPGAFNIAAGDPHAPLTLFYFSFVTLTTTGYGDILPIAPAARGLATLESLAGQLYPAILIARLVSLQVTAAGRGEWRPPDSDA